MTPKKPTGGKPAGPYILELDEALLSEAVAAVEQHSSKRLRPAAELPKSGFKPPHLRQPPPEEEVDIDIPDPTPAAAEPPKEEDSTEEPGLDLGVMAVEWDRLVAELEQTRMERDAARRHAENEARERARIAQRVKRLSEQIDQLQDQLNRSEESRRNAEQESAKAREEVRAALDGVGRMRERLRRSEEEQRTYGHAPIILTLLPVIENLERAAAHADAVPERVGEGLRMILDQLKSALERVGVRRVDASTGVMFQPALHEAVIHVPMAGVAPGTVAAELQPGYMLHGRLLRPARVSVAAPQVAAPSPGAPEKATDDDLFALSDELSVLPSDLRNAPEDEDEDEDEGQSA